MCSDSQNWRAELHRAFSLMNAVLSGSVDECGEAADAVMAVMKVDATAQWEKVRGFGGSWFKEGGYAEAMEVFGCCEDDLFD